MESESNLSKVYLKPKQEAHVRVGKNYQANIPQVSIPTHVDKAKISPTIMKLDDIVKEEKNNNDKMKIDNTFKQEEIFRPGKKRKLDV
jgi:hypothetical protein